MTPPKKESELNAFLQEFAHEIDIICALESGEKIDAKDTYKQIKSKWKNLKSKKKDLFPQMVAAS